MQLYLLFDKHYGELNELVDQLAERIQLLGGVSLAMAHDVAETTMIPRVSKGRVVLKEARTMARGAAERAE